MEYRTLGNSGCAVSTFALGTMTFGAETDESAAHEQLDRFVDAGGTFVDTADVYGGGSSEEIIGRWLRKVPTSVRERIVLATKGRFPTTAHPNGGGLSRRHLSEALDASLGRLQSDVIDLYQAHAWDPWTPIDETLRFYEDAVRTGKVRYIGFSNFTGWQVQKAVDTSDRLGVTRPVTLQPQYNLLVREVEWEIIPACQSTGLGVLPWSPLGGGWLTGKYRRDEHPTGATRLGENPERGVEAYERRRRVERTWEVVDCAARIAERRGTSMAQVALAWLVARPAVTSVILGARTVAQLEDNLGAVGVLLDAEEVAELDEKSDPAPADYPYGGPAVEQRDRVLGGGR